jgi:hypothetical protein
MMTYLFISMTLAVGQVQSGNAPSAPAPMSASGAAATTTTRAMLMAPTDGLVQPASSPATTGMPNVQEGPAGGPHPEPKTNGKDKGNGNGNGKDKGNGKDDDKNKPPEPGFLRNFWKAYVDEFTKKDDRWEKKKEGETEEEPSAPRRALPEPWSAPPFPGHEYQGYPLIGVPPEPITNPLMMGLYATPCGDELKESRIQIYGWVTVSGNWSNAQNNNSPTSYWDKPNRFELDQLVLRVERVEDTVQTDHIDWGFRSTGMYGEDYRYTTAGGWFSSQLLKQNRLYGFDPIEQYADLYIPWVTEGMVIRVGRWVACPDIETQLAPDNYLGSHSILFTFDTYTQTGGMLTFKLSDQNMVQIGLNAGDDMAPWYQGATLSGFLAWRWVSENNWTAFYTALNQIDNAEFRHFDIDGVPAGHDNYNYIVSTWEQKLTEDGTIHTKTEAYYMWERNAELGGTPSIGPVEPFGGGGGAGPTIPGLSQAYGVLNYTMFAINKMDYITVRNELWKDQTGFRTGFPDLYSSSTIGICHNFNAVMQIRPEIGYYHAFNEPAFDNGTKKNLVLYGFDFTFHF